jgi:ribosomal-protein-alanine N-acetyltransferase
MSLLQGTQRSHVAFGAEDLRSLVNDGDCLVAEVDGELCGMICATPGRDGYAFLRGLALGDGATGNLALPALLTTLDHRLSVQRATHLAAYGTDPWLAPWLLEAGFQEMDHIVTLIRHSRPLPTLPPSPAVLRPANAADVPRLAALDAAAFAPPYRLTAGDLAEALLASDIFVVAELEGGRLAGYCSAAVHGEEGHIARLAVLPATQGQGIGRAMLNQALVYCHTHATARVLINTQKSNQASLRLYEGFGFRRTGPRIPLLVRAILA